MRRSLLDGHWDAQASGQLIEPAVAEVLEWVWQVHVGRPRGPAPLPPTGESEDELSAVEGKMSQRVIWHRYRERAFRDEKVRRTLEEFGRLYQARFIGQVEAILAEGVARGDLRPLDPRQTTRLLLGMLYPFLDAAHDPEAGAADVALALTIFFEGAEHRAP